MVTIGAGCGGGSRTDRLRGVGLDPCPAVCPASPPLSVPHLRSARAYRATLSTRNESNPCGRRELMPAPIALPSHALAPPPPRGMRDASGAAPKPISTADVVARTSRAHIVVQPMMA